jgi:hypothetical protein
LCGAPSHAAAQLVELCQSEGVGIQYEHDRRVRHVDADFDHRRRDEHLREAIGEEAHHFVLLGR